MFEEYNRNYIDYYVFTINLFKDDSNIYICYLKSNIVINYNSNINDNKIIKSNICCYSKLNNWSKWYIDFLMNLNLLKNN